MKIITDMVQGSPEWHEHRAKHFNASDAPAMLGCSPYTTRQQLLREYATGYKQEVNASTQRIFDDGHRYEALARPLAEEIIGQALSPCVGTEGKLSASFDGITLLDDITFEHKSLNKDLRAIIEPGCSGSDLPKNYRVQMEQQLMVSGAEKSLFIASTWSETDEATDHFLLFDNGVLQYYKLEMALHCWYEPDAGLRDEIMQGWAQFAEDLENYQHVEVKEMPTAEIVIDLPALFVHAKGEITTHNMDEFGLALADRLAETRAIILLTDQDFSNAKAAAKKFRDTAKAIAVSKEQMLAQTETIGEAARKMDAWAKDLNATALQLEKDVDREDRNKKESMILAGKNAYAEHIAALDARIAPIRLNLSAPGFAEAIKGKRNYVSMQDAIDTTLANAKIAANEAADKIDANLKSLRELAADHKFLFNDTAQLVLKPNDDLVNVIKLRISEHQAAEQAKADALREQIRQEEEAKAKAEAEEKVRAEIAANEAKEREDAEAQAKLDAEKAAQTQRDIAEQQAAELKNAVSIVIAGTKNPVEALDMLRHHADAAHEKAANGIRLPAHSNPEANAVAIQGANPKRPTDKQIVFAVATQFNVDFHTAKQWILDMDFSEMRGAA
jgi:putative phage-type endonuclease